MTLEDSLGDILRKARTSCSVTPEAAAAAAGLSVADYTAVEDTGKAPKNFNFAAAGKLLTLSGANLEKIANGWLPKPIDTATWSEFRMITSEGDGMTVNAYLLWDSATLEAALFDTGFDAKPILDFVDRHGLALKHLFITHSHPDHIAALEPIRARFPKLRLHSNIKTAPVDQRNRANDFINLGSLRISNRDTPGHAEDGVTYIIGNWPEDGPCVAIVGDAIFAGSMGGAKQLLDLARTKVRDQILSLPDDTLICSGHGPLTTVGEQKANNPWFP
jgi:glyoxylase-like metal-dependent hydrolase (beta-lactamase superfamily II)